MESPEHSGTDQPTFQLVDGLFHLRNNRLNHREVQKVTKSHTKSDEKRVLVQSFGTFTRLCTIPLESQVLYNQAEQAAKRELLFFVFKCFF